MSSVWYKDECMAQRLVVYDIKLSYIQEHLIFMPEPNFRECALYSESWKLW